MCFPRCLPGMSTRKSEAEVWLPAGSHAGIRTPPAPPSGACAWPLTPGAGRHRAVGLLELPTACPRSQAGPAPRAKGLRLLVGPKEVILVFFSGLPAQCPHGEVTFVPYSSGVAGTPGKTHQSSHELQSTELPSANPGCLHFLLSG